MSRAYRIAVRESLTKDLKAADEICSDLEILEILPKEQMADLLTGELKGRGFQEEDGKLVREDDGVTVTVDPSSGEVNVKAEKADNVKLEVEGQDWGFDDAGPDEETLRRRLKEHLKGELKERAEEQEARMRKEASAKLEGALDEVRKELGQAVNRVTAEALKRKAASLGRIKEMTEDAESGSLTIKVEV